jgi:transcription elongation factor GreB
VLAPGAKNYLTTAGATRLQRELAQLVEHERPRLSAQASGDVDAKRELQRLDARIRHLQQSLRSAEVLSAPPPPHDVVRFGASVAVRAADGTSATYQIVGLDEADASSNRVSWQSPLARALLNRQRGEHVDFASPAGRQQLEIVDIRYE